MDETKMICPLCECVLRSGSHCYWHLRREHDLDHEQAFEQTGDLLNFESRFQAWQQRMRKRYPDGDVTTWVNLPDPADG